MAASTTDALKPGVRAVLITLLTVVLIASLTFVVVGVADVVAQLASGWLRLTLIPLPDAWQFGWELTDGSTAIGQEVAIPATITGLSAWPTVLHAIAATTTIVVAAALAICAVRVLWGIRRGRPFTTTAARDVTVAGIVLLIAGVLGQVLDWAALNAIIDELGVPNNASTYSRAPRFDPLIIGVGLTLLLSALAFRGGRRLERDTEGLV